MQSAKRSLRGNDEQDRPIALLLNHGVDAAAAMLGALKIGKCYVPLDPAFPISTIRLILEDCQANLVIAESKTQEVAAQGCGSGIRILNVDDCPLSDDTIDDRNLAPDTPSIIFYTSGTTGRPKGVLHTHRSTLHSAMLPTNLVHFCAEDRLGAPLSHSFSAYLRYFFGALLNGGLLLPFNLKESGIPALAEWIEREAITVCGFNGSMFRHFLAHLGDVPRDYPSLRLCFVGSESLSNNDIELYKTRLPDHTILAANMGTNEAGTIRNLLVDKSSRIREAILPVGFAVEDREIIIFDDSGERVGFDAIGEIAVKSDYLTAGYWRQPDLTASKFVLDKLDGKRMYLTGDLGRMSEDGCLYYFGRKDLTVKIRGYNVDTPKVEMALLGYPGVKQVAVVPQEGRNGDIKLAAYIVSAQPLRPSNRELSDFLKKALPDYMIPSIYVELEALPLTPTGKVDRRSLPKPSSARPQLDVIYTPFQNEIERELLGIWEDVLDINPIGIHDNFFDLGGHSLTASQIISRAFQRFQLQIPLQKLFQSATVADMAAVIADHPQRRLSDDELKNLLDEIESLSDENAQRLLGRQNGNTN